jgi:hypothetical protein
MGRKGTQPSRVWAVVGLGCGLWCAGRRGGSASRGGVVAHGESRRWSDGEWRRVVARGGLEGWRVAAALGTRECHVGRG